MWKSVVAFCAGASIGAVLRWGLSSQLNSWFPAIPPGTLAANLVGCYIVGAAIAFFASLPAISPEWRLLIITGFCGGLTTFSAFSAELLMLMQQGRGLLALGAAAAHVGGSLLMTLAGIGTVIWARS
jgi:CrcB protein